MTVYAADLSAALQAANDWARTIRSDWTVEEPVVLDMTQVRGHTMASCRAWVGPGDRTRTPDVPGRWLVTVRATGPFSRSGDWEQGEARVQFRVIAP